MTTALNVYEAVSAFRQAGKLSGKQHTEWMHDNKNIVRMIAEIEKLRRADG